MIAISSRAGLYVGDPTQCTDTSASLCMPIRSIYTRIYYETPVISKLKQRSLKEWRKIWAWERAQKDQSRTFDEKQDKIIIPEPMNLRGVILNGWGWANR